jgi:chaperone BCS1
MRSWRRILHTAQEVGAQQRGFGFPVLPKAGRALFGASIFLSSVLLLEPVQRELWTKITIDEGDEAFPWVTEWLHALPYTEQCLHLSILSEPKSKMEQVLSTVLHTSRQEDAPRSSVRPSVTLVPAFGTHYFLYQGKMMWLSFNKEETESGPHRSVAINILGRDRCFLANLLIAAQGAFFAAKNNKTSVFLSGGFSGSDWKEVSRLPKRDLSSVVLPGNTLRDIILDVQQFLASEPFYRARGIPFRRGLLFSGPPGVGKTSTVLAVAAALNMDIYSLNLADQELTDTSLVALIHKVILCIHIHTESTILTCKF